MIPVNTTGDGNCCFNASSMAICGNESHAQQLRLRSAIELINNMKWYSDSYSVDFAPVASDLKDALNKITKAHTDVNVWALPAIGCFG